MKTPQVSIIIVTYNSERYISRCLQSLICYLPKGEAEIIVIDNNSHDETKNKLKMFGDKIKVIFQNENKGFSLANNLAVKVARAKYLFFLNPDTEIKDNFLNPLLKSITKEPNIAVCQPRVNLMKSKQKINHTGKITHYLGLDWIPDFKMNKPSPRGDIASFSGSGVLIGKNVFNLLGGFDPLYFMYYEDSDLAWRVRLLGYRIYFVPESIIYHDYKYKPDENYQSFKRKMYFCERNRLITLVKNYQLKTIFFLLPAIILFEMAMIIYSICQGWFGNKIKGYFSIVGNIGKILANRNQIQINRVVEDRDIVRMFASKINFAYYNIFPVRYVISPILSCYWRIIKRMI